MRKKVHVGKVMSFFQLGLFDVFFGWRWWNCVWWLKIELEVHKSTATVDTSGVGVRTEGAGDRA